MFLAGRAVLVGLLVLLPARPGLDRLRALLTDNRRRSWSEELRAVERTLGGEPRVTFGSPRPIEVMFSPALVETLERAGCRVLVLPSS